MKVERHFAPVSPSSSSYILPVGDAAEDIFRDMNEKIVSLASMKTKKFSKLYFTSVRLKK